MKVFVINLARHPDRLAHMRKQMGAVPFERVAAIDGSNRPETIDGLTRFELACLASHQDVWRLLLASREDYACVLEDDLHFASGFAGAVHSHDWIPRDAHSVKLDTYLQRVKLGERRAAFTGGEVAPLYTRHQSSAAYIVSRTGAERYLELSARPALPADYCLFPRNPRRHSLRIYQVVPAVAIQDHLLAAGEGGETFKTAMAATATAKRRRRSNLQRLGREAERLIEQTGDLAEAAYLKVAFKSETTVVSFGP